MVYRYKKVVTYLDRTTGKFVSTAKVKRSRKKTTTKRKTRTRKRTWRKYY